MSSAPEVDDSDPEAGVPYPRAASWWLAGAGVLLLLPRQWASAGIAFGLSIALQLWLMSRAPTDDPPPPPSLDADDE